MRRLLKWVLLAAVLLVAAAAWWLHQPLRMTLSAEGVADVHVPAGASARQAARAVADAGVQVDERLLYAWFRLSGRSRQIKAGSYELRPPMTPRDVLALLVSGTQALRQVTLVEGWTFRQVRSALQKAPDLTDDLQGLDNAAIMAELGLPGQHPEGQFFPDTYNYPKRAPASGVLKQAAAAMQRELAAAWAERAADVPLKTPYQALILASIVEKETGLDADRTLVAGVFANRLRIGMRLQTDPTVIYGLGDAFNGNLRRSHLQADTPYNTYTRTGLPPTPIAMPGRAALRAAVQPAKTKALYFVARGDGSSQFSNSLDEHNRAVRQYQLRQ